MWVVVTNCPSQAPALLIVNINIALKGKLNSFNILGLAGQEELILQVGGHHHHLPGTSHLANRQGKVLCEHPPHS